jgi:hypothetical protein
MSKKVVSKKPDKGGVNKSDEGPGGHGKKKQPKK